MLVSVHEETGLTVPPAESKALAAAINRLLDNPNLRQTLGCAGTIVTSKTVPLELLEAENAVQIAQVVNADQYAKDTYDSAAGRQKNRRVEMVVSGDIIATPIGVGQTDQVVGGAWVSSGAPNRDWRPARRVSFLAASR